MASGGVDALIELGGGDMRRTLNLLQSTHMSAGDITEEAGEAPQRNARQGCPAVRWGSAGQQARHTEVPDTMSGRT